MDHQLGEVKSIEHQVLDILWEWLDEKRVKCLRLQVKLGSRMNHIHAQLTTRLMGVQRTSYVRRMTYWVESQRMDPFIPEFESAQSDAVRIAKLVIQYSHIHERYIEIEKVYGGILFTRESMPDDELIRLGYTIEPRTLHHKLGYMLDRNTRPGYQDIWQSDQYNDFDSEEHNPANI